MATSRSNTRERPLAAALVATALHLALFGLARLLFVPSVPLATRAPLPTEIEVGWSTLGDGSAAASSEADADPNESNPPAPASGASHARASTTPPRMNGRSLQRSEGFIGARQPSAELSDEPLSPEAASGEATRPARGTSAGSSLAPAPRIDIWNGSAAARIAMLDGLDADLPTEQQPSIGLLVEGLAERDGLAGVSRSSAAIPASYEAAQRYAPATGIAVFELQTEQTGMVQGVRLLSFGADYESWDRVREELEALLANRRLRVPNGSKGLITRLRIERGELAVGLSERQRTERGPALGQAPLHRKEERDESTRASLEPGRLSPSLGVPISGTGKPQPTRVVILSERYL